MHLRTQLPEQRRHDVFARRRDPAANDDQTIGEGYGRGHGVAGYFAQFGKCLLRRLPVALAHAVRYLAYLFRFVRVARIAGEFGVYPFHSTHGHALLDDYAGHLLVAQAESLHARVVAPVQPVVHHHADAEARAKRVAQKILVALRTAECLEPGVHFGQCAAQRFAIGEQVAVIVDEHRDAELILQERSQRHTVAERREVGQIAADDAVGVVGRARESEADGHGLLRQPVDDLAEASHHRREAEVQVVGVRRHGDRFHNEFVGLHGPEHEIRAACIERDDYAVVEFIHFGLVVCWFFSRFLRERLFFRCKIRSYRQYSKVRPAFFPQRGGAEIPFSADNGMLRVYDFR